jgi:hypothetical protein
MLLFHTILPLVLPLTAHPSARLEAEDTEPPFFILVPTTGFGPAMPTPIAGAVLVPDAGVMPTPIAGAVLVPDTEAALGLAAGVIGPLNPGVTLILFSLLFYL